MDLYFEGRPALIRLKKKSRRAPCFSAVWQHCCVHGTLCCRQRKLAYSKPSRRSDDLYRFDGHALGFKQRHFLEWSLALGQLDGGFEGVDF
jgi:hypothetical protein